MTAIAIQDGLQLIYWVAANASHESKVKQFLSDILLLLSQVYEEGGEQVGKLECQISDCVMSFSAQKL